MITTLGNQTIDLSKVERVGAVGGASEWLQYTVYFTGGGEVQFYESRSYSGETSLCPVNREHFIKIWQESKKPNVGL